MPDTGGGLFCASLVWVLILYLVVPLQYFTGQMNVAAEMLMTGPNLLARASSWDCWRSASIILLGRARLAWFELRALNPFLLLFLALALASASWSIDAAGDAQPLRLAADRS